MSARDATPHLSFHGGAGTVTGSKHLLAAHGRQILIDAGLFQGLKELRLRNWEEPGFDPRALDAVVLTHTHIDHAGYLPRLAKLGLRCPVHCTPATAALAEILLLDAAHIQEEDARYANRKKFSKHDPALPLYTEQDARRALELLRPTGYGRWIDLGPHTRARFLNVGHILGSAMVHVEVDGSPPLSVVFSGDVGRYDMPLHRDPDPPPPCDVLVIESTYGNRAHPTERFEDQIRQPFLDTFGKRGVVLIPSFAVGRAQQVTLILREMMKAGELPEVPIHIDSPMAVDATQIYSRFLDEHNLDTELVEEGRSRLFPRQVHFARTVEQSKELNRLGGPRIIISSSGMMTGGRILHHLRGRLPSRKNLLCLVGYQAAGTRGRALLSGAKTLRMHGREVPVRAQTLDIHGLSGHADRDELLRWVQAGDSHPSRVFVVHGEEDAAQALQQKLASELHANVLTPGLGESFDLS